MAENIINRLPNKCEECGKRTNKVNRSEDNPFVCRSCFEKGVLEADHQDGSHDDKFNKDCAMCYAEWEAGRADRTKQAHRDGHHTKLADPTCPLCVDPEPINDPTGLPSPEDLQDEHWTDTHPRRVLSCPMCDEVAENDHGAVDPIWYEVQCNHCGKDLTEDNKSDSFDDVCKECDAKIPSDGASPNLSSQPRTTFDHSGCDHPKTAKDRDRCRKNGAAAKFYGRA